MKTTWKFVLKAAGAAQARRLHRDVESLTASMRALARATTLAEGALSRMASAGGAGQIRSVTAAIREQTRALREQRSAMGRPRAPAALRPVSSPRAAAATPSGRMELGPAFQARARALQAAHTARMARTADSARRREEAATAAHYRGIYTAAQRNARALERLNARSARRIAQQRERVQSRESASRGGQIAGGLGMVGGVGLGLAAAATAAAAAIAGIGYSAARAGLQVLSFRESTLSALTAVTGSSTDASASFQDAIRIANMTPLDTTQTVAAMTQFRVAGFSAADTRPLMAAFADISAARGDEAGAAFQRVIAQIRGVGRVNRGDIQMQGITAGLNAGDIYDSIARQMNLGTGLTGRRAAEQAVSRRRVNNRVGEQAFLDATRQAYDNQGRGQLGDFAQGGSRTLAGALSNLSNAPTNLLLQLNTMNSPGIIAFKNAVLGLTNAFDVNQPAGRAMLATIERVTNVLGGMLGRINPGSIASAFSTISSGVGSVQRFLAAALPIARSFAAGFGPAFMTATTQLRQVFAALASGGGPSTNTLRVLGIAAQGLGRILGFVVGFAVSTVVGITSLVAAVTGAAVAFVGFATQTLSSVTALRTIGGNILASVTAPIAGIAASLYASFTGVGANIINGIIAGIRAGATGMVTSITSLGATAVASIRAALGIRSPSRVFADLVGAQIPAGIAMGVTANAGIANDAVAGIVSPRVPQLGGGGNSASITIHVSGASQPAETARAVRAELEDALGGIFGQWSEQLA